MHNSAEAESPIASIMTRLRLVNSLKACIQKTKKMELGKAQAVPKPKPNLNGYLEGASSDFAISLRLASYA